MTILFFFLMELPFSSLIHNNHKASDSTIVVKKGALKIFILDIYYRDRIIHDRMAEMTA
jgi:hypothetical protein